MAQVQLLVGTTKGLFVVRSDDRVSWTVSGPHCDLWPINHAVGDGNGSLWAGGGNEWFGAGVWRSTDGGETWSLAKLADGQMDEWMRNDAQMAEMFGYTPQEPGPHTGHVEAIWSMHRAGEALFAGGKPGMLFRSEDGGETWEMVESLSHHPTKEEWNPGAAGLILHSMVSDPAEPSKIWAAISASGVFASEDGGQSWERRNRLSNAGEHEEHAHHPAAGRGGDTGHCVHNLARATGDVIYQQNHHGVFRSRDGGRSWDDVTKGLPSRFGFPIRVHPRDADTIWTLPLNGDIEGRYPPDAAAAVWKSSDGGETWDAKRDGLPQDNCFFTVLRQGMSGDAHAPAGLYFGTNTGSIFASVDEGESWHEIARHLPLVLSVEVA